MSTTLGEASPIPDPVLGRLGVWHFTDGMSTGEAVEFAARLEKLGFSALWLPDTIGRDPFAHIATLARETSTLAFATGIASIFHRHPGPMKQAAYTLAEQTGGRFLLGLGVSHAVMVTGVRGLDYSKPLSRMRAYLEAMDQAPYGAAQPITPPLRLLAALGPNMLMLAKDAADGALPYWTTPEHTAQARDVLGPDKLLCVEQKVVLTTDRTTARSAAQQALAMYVGLPNYRNHWKRLGFADAEIDAFDDCFIDAVVAWGSADTIADRLREHFDAGADHVCIQPLTAAAYPAAYSEVDWACLEALAADN